MNIREDYQVKEGSCYKQERQKVLLKELVKGKSRGLQIGLNAGDSAYLFLEETQGTLISYDIGTHKYIDEVHKRLGPNHKLVKGDSVITLTAEKHRDYDYIYIDGGHSYRCASNDLKNCLKIANKDTLIILDDYVRDKELIRKHNVGVIKAYAEIKVRELGQEDFGKGRGLIYFMIE